MALFLWNDSYSVSVSEIDNQHKKLVELVNKLHEAMQKGQAKEIIGTIISELVNYTKTHFSYEERYMQLAKYPDYENHKTAHNEFITKVSDFQNKFQDGSVTLSIPIMNFLKDWIVQHIKDIDAKYSACLVKYGLK